MASFQPREITPIELVPGNGQPFCNKTIHLMPQKSLAVHIKDGKPFADWKRKQIDCYEEPYEFWYCDICLERQKILQSHIIQSLHTYCKRQHFSWLDSWDWH